MVHIFYLFIDILLTIGYTHQKKYMKNDNSLKYIGVFLAGVVITYITMVNNYFPKYQGKTASQWNETYTALKNSTDSTIAQSKSNGTNVSGINEALLTCLDSNKKYQDYYGGRAFMVYDVSDVNYCISTARDQGAENNVQQFEQQQSDEQNNRVIPDPNNTSAN